MSEFNTVSDVARQINCKPRDISDLFYDRELSDADCPIVGGKRLIPNHYIPQIITVLQKHKLIADPTPGDESCVAPAAIAQPD